VRLRSEVRTRSRICETAQGAWAFETAFGNDLGKSVASAVGR
jgi:hypothetical protein